MSDYVLPANAPLPGEMFAERYRIDRILGVGGMGFVVAATHVHLHEKVAIKMLLPELASNKQTVERFLREGRAAVKIRSEHVARVLDVGELAADRTPYLVMEYLDGCDLALYLESNGKVEPAKAVAWVLEACEAIAEAHAMKTVHRDLKPANLFLAQQPNGGSVIKVLDFGISKMTGIEKANLAMTKTSAMLGSPLYMSPEQLRSARNVDERSDIWSIGVILYELIVGHPPYFAETLAELGALVLTGETPRVVDAVPSVPVELSDVIATCMQKKAEDRFVNLADFANAIASFGAMPGSEESAQNILKTLGGMPKARAAIASSSSAAAAAGPARSGSNPSLTPLIRTQPLATTPPSEIDPRSDPRIVAADTVDIDIAPRSGDSRLPNADLPLRRTPNSPFPGYGVTASGIVAQKKGAAARAPGMFVGVLAFVAIAVGGAVLFFKQAHVAPASATTISADTSSSSPASVTSATAETSAAASSATPTSSSAAIPEASASVTVVVNAKTATPTPKPTPVTPKLTPAAAVPPHASATPKETASSTPVASAPPNPAPPTPPPPPPTTSATITKPSSPSQIATSSKD